MSTTRFFFILKSRGVSVLKEGEWFTSRIQGFNSESNITSKPSNSKHMAFSESSGWQDLYIWAREGYTAHIVFIIVSLMELRTLLESWPMESRYL